MHAGLLSREYTEVFSHAGLVDEAKGFFNSMKQFGIAPTIVHYNCVVDAIARKGLLEEAEDFVKKMEKPNVFTWTILLGTSCNICNT